MEVANDSKNDEENLSIQVKEKAPLLDEAPEKINEDIAPKNFKEPSKLEKNVIFFLFIAIGCAVMLPYNCMANCSSFFFNLFPERATYIMSVIAFVFLFPNGLAVLLMQFNSNILNVFGYLTTQILPYVFAIVFLCGFTLFGGWIELNETVAFVIIIIVDACMGFFLGIMQGACFTLSVSLKINADSTIGMMTGYGLVGITMSLLRIITKLTLESDPSHSSFTDQLVSSTIYFVVCGLLMFLFCLFFIILVTLLHSKGYLNIAKKTKKDDDTKKQKNSFSQLRVTLDGLKLGWYNSFLIMILFFVSLGVFPGVVVAIPVTTDSEFLREWFAIIIIFLFTLFDFVGRSIPKIKWLVISERNCFKGYVYVKAFIVILRIAFIPLFLLCFANPFPHLDILAMILMVIMAMSNGYFCTMLYVDNEYRMHKLKASYSTKLGLSGEEKIDYENKICNSSALFMTFFMLLGIVLGSFSGILYSLFVPQKL